MVEGFAELAMTPENPLSERLRACLNDPTPTPGYVLGALAEEAARLEKLLDEAQEEVRQLSASVKIYQELVRKADVHAENLRFTINCLAEQLDEIQEICEDAGIEAAKGKTNIDAVRELAVRAGLPPEDADDRG